MKINKERSKNIKKLLSLSLAAEMMLAINTGAKADTNQVNFDYQSSIEAQIDYHNRQYELNEKIRTLSESLYDKEYNDYCDNETININGNDYLIKYLHLEYGYLNNQKIVYLKDYHNPHFDIITGKIIDKDYVREKIIALKDSLIFYQYYHDDNIDKNIIDYINRFNGEINYSIPETYYYNPIHKNIHIMEKIK